MRRWYEPVAMALTVYISLSTMAYMVWVLQTGNLNWHMAYWIPTLLALVWAQTRCLRPGRRPDALEDQGMDDETYQYLSDVFKDLTVISDSEMGALRPSWSFSLDPQTGIGVISFRPELLMNRREIHRMASTIEMRLHNLSLLLAEAHLKRARQ